MSSLPTLRRLWLPAIALCLSLPMPAQAAPPSYVPGHVIVKYREDAPALVKGQLRATLHSRLRREFSFIRAEVLEVEGMSVEQAIARARLNPSVEYAEPDYEIHLLTTPNDPRFPEMYAMRNTGQTGGTPGADIRATAAWDLFTGDPNLLVGVIDTGFDYTHPDLAANAWTNPGEIPGNGIDDEGNGYVDDVHGYDFVNNDPDPFDDQGHGTHTSGTIGAVGNNGVGVVGVNWQVKVAGIKFLDSSGSGSTEGAISGINYAIAIGCRLTSNSWGGGGFSQALLDAINAAGAAGQLFVAAAGNSGANTDLSPSYPASYDSPYIISVAATDHDDGLASFSNFGATTVDLGAPGVDILSTFPTGSCSLCDPSGYGSISGTSMATPHVAGAAALLLGRFPGMTNLQAKARILQFADPVPSLTGKCVTGGRLNLLMAIADPDSLPPGQIMDLAASVPGSTTMGLTWTATGDDDVTGRASRYEIRYSTSPIDAGNFGSATLVTGPDPLTAGSAESFEIGGLTYSTPYYFAIKAFDEFGNAGPISNVPVGTTLGIPDIATAPPSLSEALLTGATSTQTLTISNAGEGTLDFTVPTPELSFTQGRVYEAANLGKDEPDTRVGDPVIMAHGGPDGFGYRWIDSDDPTGPTFAWVDITGVGAGLSLTGDDVTSAAIPMGMTFPFYGSSFSTVRVCTNGFLSFTDGSTAYTNTGLPSSGGAANLVAPFWDDLDFGATPRVYTYNDGSRFIVEYVGAPHYSSGGPYTFEAILYPSGEIRYQYLTMGSPTNSATVGIQNQTKSIGLTAAFNTAYLHDNMAVRILPLQQWLTVTPTSGRVHAGASTNLDVHFNAAGLVGGDYTGTIHINTNDPDENPANVAASLHVTGAPNLTATPANSHYGEVFVGSSNDRTVVVANTGTDALNITGITVTASGGPVTALPSSFSLAPGASQNVTVNWTPSTAAPMTASLDIASNDPDEPTKTVYADGNAVPAPSFSVNPGLFDVTLNTNTATSQNLRITNNGGSNYVYTADAVLLGGTSASVQVHTDAENVALAKGEPDRVHGPAPLASGGPDAFGYRFKDGDEVGGPAFNWVELNGVGTQIPLNGDDQNLGTYPIGFSFPFYGNTFSSFRICTNGFVSFSSTQTTYTNTALPNNGSGVPENLLALFWDDLDFRSAGQAWYRYDGARLIIEYDAVPRLGSAEIGRFNSFEIILYPDGRILYQYLSMTAATLNSATIGIQNQAKDDGLQVAFNAAYVHNNLAILFSPPARFLTVSPTSGSVPPGGFQDLTVGFNAGGLFGGTYDGAVRLNGNDPIVPQLDVTATLHVIGVPDIASAPGSLDYGNVFVGFPATRQLQVKNLGTDSLRVNEIVSNDPSYSPDLTGFTVPPLGSRAVNVSFSPPAAQSYPATLTVKSNDPDSPAMHLDLTGAGLIAPDIAASPGSMNQQLPPEASSSQTLTIQNTGGSPLNFTVGASVDATSSAMHDALPLGKGQADPRPGILGSGGPDAFGYRWKDSDESGGPTFGWVDITGVGAEILSDGDDRTVLNVPIGFSFSFYGNTFNTVNVCTNGWISFSHADSGYSNEPLPNAGSRVPENLVAPFWDDQDLRTTGSIYVYNDGSRFIVAWVGVPHYTSGGPYTYEAILYPNGRIVYQYLSMGNPLDSGTIGIQDAARTTALQVVYNTPYLHNNLAVEIKRTPDWLSVNPLSGTVPAGGSQDLTVGFNSSGLEDGSYTGKLRLTSNDPDEVTVDVPVTLVVNGVTGVNDRPLPVAYGVELLGANPTRGAANFEVALPSRGAVDARVYDLRGALVRQVSLGVYEAGYHTLRWAGTDTEGRETGSGIYFLQVRAGGRAFREKVVLVH